MNTKLYKVSEAAAILRLSRSTLFRMQRIGRLSMVKLGPRSNRIAETEINRIATGRK